MTSPLHQYFSLRIKNLFNHLHDFELTEGDVPLHDFRIEMKKLKAIIKFLRTVYPKQKFKKITHNIGNVFQHTGEIREYQVLQQWLHKNELLHIIKTYFPDQNMEDMIEVFHHKSFAYKQELKEVIEHCGKFVQHTNSILAEQYVTELNAQIEKMIQRHLEMSDWHELRKLIKQWMYAINWIDNKEEETKSDSQFSYYNKLQEAIGYWHDLELIKESFTQKQIFLSTNIDIHKDFSKAWERLNAGIRYREKQVEEMLHKLPVLSQR
jgi:CHAD domain-containing protein